MIKYIHIGFPKNLSTTLQRDYFAKNSQIRHLGVGIQSNIDYINSEINRVCEVHLLYSKNRIYSKKKENILASFEKEFNLVCELGFKATGISAELLSFSFSPNHIDPEEKAKRLFEIFDSNTKVICIIRNQVSLIQSLYRECVKIGYSLTFREFIEYCYYFHHENFISDFNYYETYQLYSELFGRQNVSLIPIENVRDSVSGELLIQNGKNILIEKLDNILGLEFEIQNLGHYNEALNSQELEYMRYLNAKRNHNFSKGIMGTVNGHRLADYFNNELKLPLPEFLAQDVITKRENIDEAKNTSSAKIDYYKDELIWQKLLDLFREDNSQLKEIIPSLPTDYDF